MATETRPDREILAIEVSFAVPVEPTSEQFRRLADLIEEIARANTPAGHVHWLSEMGSKPQWSKHDALFLGVPVDPLAPEHGEPTFDHSTLHFGTTCRERFENEGPTMSERETEAPTKSERTP